MADDVEVIFEGQELFKYSKEIGFNIFDVEKRVGSTPSSPNAQPGSTTSSSLNVTRTYFHSAFSFLREPWTSSAKSMDQVMLYKHIQIILESGLLFEDDVQFVNNVLPSSSAGHATVSKKSWRNTTMNMISTFPSVCFNIWQETALPFAGFILFDVFWNWKKNKQYQQHLEQERKLLCGMKDLYIVFSKAMKLLQENELILRGFTLARTGSTVSRLECSDLPCLIKKWDSSPGLRIAVRKALMEAIYILSHATQTLISCCPLFGQLDNKNHYMSFLDFKTFGGLQSSEDDIKLSHLKRLHHIFFLLQSEFLRRLALCYCPVLWKQNSLKQVRNVIQVVCNVTEHCSKLFLNLSREYNVFYSFGISDKIQEGKIKPPFCKSESMEKAETQIAVRSASLHLRTLLLNTRALEEKLESREEDNFEDIIFHLSDIIRELDVCRSCCEEGISQIKKLITPPEESSKTMVKPIDLIVNTNETMRQISVGYTDLDPHVEDEVFESVITNETGSGTSYSCEEVLNEEQMQYEMAKQLSKKMMQELKSVLVIKAEKWKEREAKALQARQEPSHLKGSETRAREGHEVYNNKENVSSCTLEIEDPQDAERESDSPEPLQDRGKLSSSCLSIDRKESPLHKLLHEHRTESCGSLERCTDSPVSNASSSSQASRSPKHVYASETFRPLRNDLQFSVGLHLSNDALAKFQARRLEASDTFTGMGEKSSSEESLGSNSNNP